MLLFAGSGSNFYHQLVLMKSMSDLCATCHQNSTLILRAANAPEEVKSDTLKKAEEHLYLAQLEQSFYKTTCKKCEKSILEHFTTGDSFQLSPLAS